MSWPRAGASALQVLMTLLMSLRPKVPGSVCSLPIIQAPRSRLSLSMSSCIQSSAISKLMPSYLPSGLPKVWRWAVYSPLISRAFSAPPRQAATTSTRAALKPSMTT